MQRGKIHYKKRAAQFNDFSGVRYGNMTPTDIDGILEYHNILYIILEGKLEDAPFRLGQQLMHERLNDDIAKPCLTILYSHNYPQNRDVDVANCLVYLFYRERQWFTPNQDVTVKALCDSFIKEIEE